MKNKLPNPVQVDTHGSIAFKINQLIDYLAELTEVVERKQDNFVDVENSTTTTRTPSLKETLLNDFKVEFFNRDRKAMEYSDVEAIINRLIK